MRFELIKGDSPETGYSVDTADCPNNLDYSTLHHCNHWSVWVYWDDGSRFKVAHVVWLGGASYCFHDPYTDEQCCIREHDHIIPMVRGALFYNHLFGRYESCITTKTISVFPVGG